MNEETLFEQKVTVQDQRAGTSKPVESPDTEPSEATESSDEQLDFFNDVFDGDLVEDTEDETENTVSDEEQEPLPEGDLTEEPEKAEESTDEVVEEPQTKSEARNYDDFDESERPLLKQMSNAAFEKYAKNKRELIEAKSQIEELSKQSPEVKKLENLHEHPEAYTLSDEYKEAASNYGKAETEFKHWKQQLINVRNGEPWQSIEGYNDKGQIVVGKQQYQANPSSEIDIESALQEAKNFMTQFGQQASQIQHNYSSDYANANNMLVDEQKKYFEWEGDDKKLNIPVETVEGKSKTIQDIKKSFSDSMPKNFKKHPITNLASNLYVTLQLYSSELSKLKKQLDIVETNKKDSRRVEPKSTSKTESVNDEEMFSADGFEKLLG
jgi:hypothetical protein